MAHPSNSSGSVANNKCFEVITTVLLKNQFFRDVMICRPLNSYRCSEVQCCLHFHSQAVCIVLTYPRDHTKCTFRRPIGRLTHLFIALSHFLHRETKKQLHCPPIVGRDSSVGIATCNGLDDPGIESR